MTNDSSDFKALIQQQIKEVKETQKERQKIYTITEWEEYDPKDFTGAIIHELLEYVLTIREYLKLVDKQLEKIEPIPLSSDADVRLFINVSLGSAETLKLIIDVIREYWKDIPEDWPKS